MYRMRYIQNPVYYRKFRHIQACSCPIKAYLEPCVTLAYLEPCHIQNPVIFRTQDIQNSVKVYSGIFRTLSTLTY